MIALIAALAMVIQDIFEVLKDQAQTRNRAVLAGLFDTLMYLALVSSMTVSVTTLQGHSLKEKTIVLTLISAANFFGQYTGVKLGKKLIKEEKV